MPDPSEPEVAAPARRRAPMLAGFLALSLALHALLFMSLPAFRPAGEPPPPQVLDVVLLEIPPEPVPEAPPSPPARPQPLAARPKAREREAPAPGAAASKPPAMAPSALPDPEPRVLTSPKPGPTAASREPQAALQPEAASPAPDVPSPPAPAASPKRVPVTPPQFNAGYLRNPPPRYPLIARRRGEEGTVTLRVHVQRDGVPSSVTLEQSSGSEALDAAALDAVRQWRFAPARRGEERVDAWVLVPIVFRLEGAS